MYRNCKMNNWKKIFKKQNDLQFEVNKRLKWYRNMRKSRAKHGLKMHNKVRVRKLTMQMSQVRKKIVSLCIGLALSHFLRSLWSDLQTI